ncbi:MAG: nitroreductase family protein [Defluviitaleaceae bacterium]|nr:nitroreductase family protein [Defluviitaleaceae bacterium]
MNDVLKTIQNRFSCRGYTGEAVAPSDVRAIAAAGLQAPSAKNFQPWKIIAINNKSIIDKLDNEGMEYLKSLEDQRLYQLFVDRGGKLFYNAPALFIVLKEENPQGTWVDIDCGILVQNMALAATSLELNTCIVAFAAFAFNGANAEEMKKTVQWPDGYEFAMGLLVGEGNTTKEPHEIDWDKVVVI